MTPRRDSKGRFVARKRRNPDGAMFRDAEGRLHPIRSWAGYDAGKTTAGPGKTAPPTKPARRPKVGTAAERAARAAALLATRKAAREGPKRVHIRSSDRMSNRQYHLAGKPHWWVRLPSGAFAHIPGGWQRGDDYLDTTVEIPRGVTSVAIGAGPNNRHGIRERVTV